jgi:hypothetical protein
VRDCWQEFDVAVGRWRLGEVRVERLPAAAMQALSSGCEAPSLGHLAAKDGSGWSEVEPLVARVLRERGRAVPGDDEALKCVADDVLRRMAAGDVAPEEATTRLRHLSAKALDRPGWEDLRAFHHLALDWEAAEDAGFDLDALREEMAREARELLDRGGVRLR